MDASRRIDDYVASLADWRGKRIARLRKWIAESDEELVESWKWGTPVWTRGGNVVAIGAFKDHVKVNFFDGASLPDPKRLFNAGLEAKKTRAIDLREGEDVDRAAFQALVRSAAARTARGQ